ncbi:helix-turn-helix domain-containing protein [Alistipes onderdonkii]|uniref:Helix-turn-helix domain-containing protein n=1 Tax=Alistipes onderdonkii TaxID=328813 RepID=A0A9P3ZIA4_9BACT|nr:helix-turn-helix domain-containing protein [Alistipes onderdonkii]MTT00593.1 DNA-binding protein [Proteus mirabilis]NAD41274.1 DNA-binding protein [Escherichia coli]KAA2410113.1 helix-turn-helix domain-containing protein [Alistipes onderdonkii]KAA2413972.1 helix-turn-helix domain-containing protein [Alistipes onderdonkii]KAA2417437.1 helix-turn-helix domain-containing protein [Alistipes onderdonkii]
MALNISPRTLQYYRNKGIIPYSFIGNKIYYEAPTIASILSQGLINHK